MIFPGDAYRDFEKWCNNHKQLIYKNSSFHPYFDEELIFKRFFQLFIHKTNEDYSKYYIQNKRGPIKRFGPFIIENETIKIRWKSRLKYIIIFLSESTLIFFKLILSVFKKSPEKKACFNVIIEPPIIGSIEDLQNFLHKTKIKGLNQIDKLIIKKRDFSKNQSTLLNITTNPWIYIVKANFSIVERLTIAIRFFSYTLVSLYYLNKKELNILIHRDIASSFLVRILDKRKYIKNIYITNSSFQEQALWLKGLKNNNLKSHMIWYSQNFIPKFYVGESKQSYLPGSNLIQINHHWVWTKKFGEMIMNQNPTSTYTAINSIMFYPVENSTLTMEKRIMIFDVIPFKPQKVTFGATYNYYSERTITKFVNDIVVIVEELNKTNEAKIQVVLKTKRSKHSIHSETYFKYLDKMEVQYPFFKIVDSRLNIYKLIDEAFIAFSVPFTSTAEIAHELGTPSYFYDPSANIHTNKVINHLPLLSSKEELKKVIHVEIDKLSHKLISK